MNIRGKRPLLFLAAALVLAIIATWGSIGSIILLFCLVMLVCSVLYQKFVTNRENDDFQSEV